MAPQACRWLRCRKTLEVSPGIAPELSRVGQQQHVDLKPFLAQVAGTDQAIAAVVALAAHDDHPPPEATPEDEIRQPLASSLHQL